MSNEITVPIGLGDVDRAVFLSKLTRKASTALRQAIYQVHKNSSWQGRFESWDAFVESEDGLDISRSLASKLIKVEEEYVEKLGFSSEKLEGIDNEKLYLAIPLLKERDASTVIETARLLTRNDIKKETAEKGGKECDHHNQGTICFTCNARL